MFLLRMAHVHRKVLIIIWTRPKPIDDFLVPNRIDWTVAGLPRDVVDALHAHQHGMFDLSTNLAAGGKSRVMALAAGEQAEQFEQERMVRMQVNVKYTTQISGADDADLTHRGDLEVAYGR
jgi:hypothetical protein